MQVQIDELRPYLQAFDFPKLLVEGLGWDHYHAESVRVHIGGHDYILEPAAEKAGFVVYVCGPGADGSVPTYPIRRKIENQVAKLAYEHLIIFVDADQTLQVWQWVKREAGKPAACREQTYHSGQSGEALLQRLQPLFVSLDEEPSLNIALVASRVRAALDVEKVTKRFYERFSAELTAFGNFIDGITGQGDRDWYASLMLNRMMFVYFVQKQGFMDGDPDYLRNKLDQVRRERGEGKFQLFYYEFLRRLFHEGLGQPEAQRASDLAVLLGRVPFLNGGLFDVHDLEQDNLNIAIPDEAFERVFNFFDDYRWHLDERPYREDNEINPDVLGYIFEKYVNQKQMGAYYTKEDITGYISRNTVIPFLFDAAKKECPVAFGPDGGVWRLLQDDPDRYIYPAVGHGITWNARELEAPELLDARHELPDEIAAGIDEVSKRGGWNRPAPEDYALPTETWREVVARRTRFHEVRSKLAAGEVTEVNDLITLNLDMERFAKDVIAQSEGPELLRAFWHALRDVSVLDPTCGSGAFLFAALNILEPLYTACLEGMRGFLDDLERSERPHSPNALSDFRDVLEQVERHPSERYFILKSIVLNNLYGVDIMEEAVEICKLRLFLKLVAQLESYDQIEPLPDIDFNIRAGNTLVGFISLDAVRRAMTITPDGQHRQVFPEEQEALGRIEEEAEIASAAFEQFRWQQTLYGGEVTPEDKAALRTRLDGLRDELDRYLATEYGVDLKKATAYDAWRASHQPFHWFVEFYGIMSKGGFDVVIGNPPYVNARKVRQSYTAKGLRTVGCPDIYSMVVERATELCKVNGRTSMIVPLSIGFSEDFAPLREYLYEHCGHLWFSSFGRIPSALFSFDTRVRNTIYLAKRSIETAPSRMTTRLHRWFDSERPFLFDNLSYCSFLPPLFGGLVPKLGNARLVQGLETLLSGGDYRLASDLSPSRAGFPLHFKQTAYNWLTFCVEKPPVIGPDGAALPQTGYGSSRFLEETDRDLSLLLTNGLLIYTWWVAVGDDFHLTLKNFTSAPFGPKQLSKRQRARMLKTAPKLAEAMTKNVVYKLNAGKNIGNYNLAKCRRITDEIDKAWLQALGLRDLWEEIELEHNLVVRTSYSDDE
ncbi:MAG: SAM-dependent methyltransferase [Chloroflexi bacterium]|nr:SAM-dependent methyltransferase [Chloroflexota bacterium]MYD49656.1 SAM-dependent methyltransferase [Chloroflexota bacterium]